jgi:quinol monooxygenase YgiN
MVTNGLLVRLEARRGREEEVEDLLRSALPMVREEPATTAWFAVRFGEGRYGIFDVFKDGGREAHLSGPVAKALGGADGLFAADPEVQKLDVLADKLPAPVVGAASVTKGLLVTLEPQSGKEEDVERFLRDTRPIVQREPDTTAWFAVRIEDGNYGIFDVFPDRGGRFAHLTGRVPIEIGRNVPSLLGSPPDTDLVSVLTDKLPSHTRPGSNGRP